MEILDSFRCGSDCALTPRPAGNPVSASRADPRLLTRLPRVEEVSKLPLSDGRRADRLKRPDAAAGARAGGLVEGCQTTRARCGFERANSLFNGHTFGPRRGCHHTAYYDPGLSIRNLRMLVVGSEGEVPRGQRPNFGPFSVFLFSTSGGGSRSPVRQLSDLTGPAQPAENCSPSVPSRSTRAPSTSC